MFRKYREYNKSFRNSAFINPTQTKLRRRNIENYADPLFKRRQATFLKPEFGHAELFVSGSDIVSIKSDMFRANR